MCFKDDTISRDGVIKTINKVRDVCDTESLDDYRDLLVECFEVLPSAQPEQRWIPVTERLPAYGEDVLISIGGYCNVGHIVSVNEEEQYNWYFSGWYHLPNDVDAWMPLPEPYGKKVKRNEAE